MRLVKHASRKKRKKDPKIGRVECWYTAGRRLSKEGDRGRGGRGGKRWKARRERDWRKEKKSAPKDRDKTLGKAGRVIGRLLRRKKFTSRGPGGKSPRVRNSRKRSSRVQQPASQPDCEKSPIWLGFPDILSARAVLFLHYELRCVMCKISASLGYGVLPTDQCTCTSWIGRWFGVPSRRLGVGGDARILEVGGPFFPSHPKSLVKIVPSNL